MRNMCHTEQSLELLDRRILTILLGILPHFELFSLNKNRTANVKFIDVTDEGAKHETLSSSLARTHFLNSKNRQYLVMGRSLSLVLHSKHLETPGNARQNPFWRRRWEEGEL